MKVFLTGATGFVGHHVAKALAADGAKLRLLVRKTSSLANLEGIAGETHTGDLSDPSNTFFFFFFLWFGCVLLLFGAHGQTSTTNRRCCRVTISPSCGITPANFRARSYFER